MKSADAFTCPHCGKRTVTPINQAGGELLSVHKIVYGIDKKSSVPREIIIRFCTQKGTEIIDGVIPRDRLLCDLPKPDKPISKLSSDLRFPKEKASKPANNSLQN